jgi:hypothetical protein
LKPGGNSITDCICEEGYECDYAYLGEVKIEITDKLHVQDPVKVRHSIIQGGMKKKKSNIRLMVVPANDREEEDFLTIRSYV